MSTPSTVLAARLLVRVRLRHLHVFLKVAELGSLQRAAPVVGMSQPAASHVLADLEKLLECVLFHRYARGMKLSRTGMALLPFARRMLDQLYESADVVSALQHSADSQVRIASITSGIMGILASALPEFSRQHPRLLFQIQELDIEQIGLAVSRGDVDLVLCRQPEAVPGGWAFQPLVEDRFIVVAGTSHPFAARKKLSLAQLWKETWLQGPIASAARRAFDTLAAEAGASPSMRMVSTRSPAIFWSMLHGQRLVSLMPLSFARQMLDAGQLCRLPIDIDLPFEPLGMMHLAQEEGEAARLAREFLQQWTQQMR
jgi:DNA-binding transcriptional LysR family regulator